jgi:hypothetical protein
MNKDLGVRMSSFRTIASQHRQNVSCVRTRGAKSTNVRIASCAEWD